MADQYGLFWNSINSDRTYDADSFAEWLRKFFTTGIFNGEMQVTPSTGMTVSVAPGYANLNGKVRFFDAIQTFTLDPASGSYPRIDTIVVRSDSTNRIITTEYVKGAYSGNNPGLAQLIPIILLFSFVTLKYLEILQAGSATFLLSP